MMKKYIVFIIIIMSCTSVFAQDRYIIIENKLDSLSKIVDGLNQEVDFTASGVSIQEFIRGIGLNNKINISIDTRINNQLINNFSQVKAKEILVFLCRKYSLEITITGNIISIEKYTKPKEIVRYEPKKLKISFDSATNNLNLDLHNDTLYLIAKAITSYTGQNIILTPEIKNSLATTYIQDMPIESSLSKLAFSNSLEINHTDDGFYILSKKKTKEVNSKYKTKYRKKRGKSSEQDESNLIVSFNNGLISINALNADIKEIIKQASNKSGVDYIMLEPIDHKLTMIVNDVSFDNLLRFLLSGSTHSFSKENKAFIIGKKDNNKLKTTKAIKLQHRSVIDFATYIPTNLKGNLEIIEFKEQNSIIVNGSQTEIANLEKFIRTIDQVVPMIVIDVLIIDNKSNYTIETGVKAGISDKPIQSTLKLLPEADVTLGAQSINQLINSFNGLGFVNLGHVTPNFYLSIKALEANGVIKVNSTPKLATLNGSEAKLTLGNTTYYYEERNDVITNQSTQNIQTKQYKSLKADFTVTIRPIVSGDEQVTLEITVDQSDFTGEVVEGAPPGQVTRSFTSTVRVKNQDMILLGGLEERSKSEESRGWPILSRIPIIKWLFSSRKKEKKTSKLNIFVKPTIIY